MASREESACVGCGISPCMHCGAVTVYICDKCGDEIDSDEHYKVDDEDLCENCLKDRFRAD